MYNVIGYGFFIESKDFIIIKNIVDKFSSDIKCYYGNDKIFICLEAHRTEDSCDFNKKEETLLFQVKPEDIKLINILFYRLVDDYIDGIDDDVGWKSMCYE